MKAVCPQEGLVPAACLRRALLSVHGQDGPAAMRAACSQDGLRPWPLHGKSLGARSRLWHSIIPVCTDFLK